MTLASLIKEKHSKVLGIDASTKSIAFCIIEDLKPIKWGEIQFVGNTVYERMLDAKRKVRALKDQFNCNYVAIEAAVMVRSANTGLKMAYIFGAIMGELLENKATVIEIHPITWQSFIGNNNFTKAEKTKLKIDYPNQSDNWYKSKMREIRKSRTIEFASNKGVQVESDNVADAFGIAWYAANKVKND